MKYTVHWLSDTGRARQLNEDSIRVEQPTDAKLAARYGELYVIADGMGGHESGEIASQIAVDTIISAYYGINGRPDEALRKAIEQANAEVYRRAQEESRQGMGTTVVAASRVDDNLYIAHVGDSRLYLIRDDKIRPMTEDHSMVAEQVKAGILTKAEAEHHPYRNVISRAVGTASVVEVELSANSPLKLEEGDVVLLCSDGLTEHVKPNLIRELVRGKSPEAAAEALIQKANDNGGSDNISVIILRVGDAPPSLQEPATAVMAAGDTPTQPNPALGPAVAEAAPLRRRNPFLSLLAFLLIGLVVVGGWYLYQNPAIIGALTPQATVAPTVQTMSTAASGTATPVATLSPGATASPRRTPAATRTFLPTPSTVAATLTPAPLPPVAP